MNQNIVFTLAGFFTLHVGVHAQFSREGTAALRRTSVRQPSVSTAAYRQVNALSPRLILRGEDRQAEIDKAVANAIAKFKASIARTPAIIDSNTQYRGLNNSYKGSNRCYGTQYAVPRIYHFGGSRGRIIVSPQINCLPRRAPYRYYGVDSGPCGTSIVIIKKK
jgi:hypothetical protein